MDKKLLDSIFEVLDVIEQQLDILTKLIRLLAGKEDKD